MLTDTGERDRRITALSKTKGTVEKIVADAENCLLNVNYPYIDRFQF